MDEIRAAVFTRALEENLVAAVPQEPGLRFVLPREAATMLDIPDLVHGQPGRHCARQLQNWSERELRRLLVLDERVSGALGDQSGIASLVGNGVVLVVVVGTRDGRLRRRALQQS